MTPGNSRGWAVFRGSYLYRLESEITYADFARFFSEITYEDLIKFWLRGKLCPPLLQLRSVIVPR